MRTDQMVIGGLALLVVVGGVGYYTLGDKTTEAPSAGATSENAVTAGTPNISATTSDERIAAAIATLAAAGPAEVTSANRREYYLQCRPCHSITKPDGEVIELGSGLGPDLYGIIDKPAGMQEGFAYSESMLQAAEAGLVWTVENILRYSYNPKRFLREATGDVRAEGTMVYSLVKGHVPLITYLEAVGPTP
ncbi:cytochrome c family protein [Phaeovulum sp.]|uniref:c-type cytochrome n=1 Tax=Phaeovulum sp. TaxID=2934796 RepID=UPI0035613ADA